MANQEQTIFRKKTLERISSPEQLTDYLRVTNPGIWIVLAAVIVLLAGLFIWSATGTLETTAPVNVLVENRTAQVASGGGEELAPGMIFRVASQEYVIAAANKDDFGRTIGIADVALPDGSYEGTVVTESIRPLDFLLSSR